MTAQTTTPVRLVSAEIHPCTHAPACPSATDKNYLAAEIITTFHDMDCALLCNGRYAFGDDIRAAAPHKPLVRVELQASLHTPSRLHTLVLNLISWLSRRRGSACSPIVRGTTELADRRRAIGASGSKLTIHELHEPTLKLREGFPMPSTKSDAA